MKPNRSYLDTFVRGVRRRAAAWRVVESTGLGIAVGAVAGGALVGVMLWNGGDGRTMAVGALAVGAVAGLVRGVARRPSLLEAAGEADRQLNLHDLLATGLTMRASADPWAQLVVAQADRRATQLRPRDVLLQRLGARAWGGIGIATAIVVVMASLSAQPNDLLATADRSPTTGRSGVATRTDSQTAGDATRPPRQTEAASKDGSVIPSADPAASVGRSTRGGATDSADVAADGGGGAARSDVASIGPDAAATGRSDAVPNTGTAVESGDGRATTASGAAGQSTAGRVTGGASASSEAALGPARMSPPRDGVPVPLESIPDAYRDVARFYFDASGR